MKNLLTVLLAIFVLSGCASQPETPFEIAVSNFSWVPDTDGATTVKENLKSLIIYDINKPFADDCESFALSLRAVMGGKVWYTVLPGEGAHAVLVKDGVVYDYLKGEMLVNEYPSKMLFWFDAVGNYGTN